MATIRQITMYKDVGFDLTHKHCLDFENSNQRDAYFDGLTEKTSYADCNYNKADRTLNLECDWETGLTYTYCTFMYGDKRMFYFVTGCRVVNDKVTGFELQLDVWQTFLFEFTISEGMITREHVDRWDRDGKVLWRKGVNEDKISVYDKCVNNEIDQIVLTNESGYIKFRFGGIYITYLKTIEENKRCYVTALIPTIESDGIPINEKTSFQIHYDVEGQTVIGSLMSSISVLHGNLFANMNIDPQSVISICYQPNIEGGIRNGVTITSMASPAGEHWYLINVPNNEPLFNKFTNRNIAGIQSVFYDNYEEYLVTQPYTEYPRHELETFECINVSISKPVKPANNDDYSPTHEPELFKSPYIVRSLLNIDGSMISEINDVCWFDNNTIRAFMINDNNSEDCCYIFSDKNYLTSNEFLTLCNKGIGFRIKGMDIDVPSDVWKSYVISSRDTDRQMLQSTINQQAITSSIGAIVGMGGISGMAGSGKGAGLGFNPAQAIAGGSIGGVMGLAGWMANNNFGWEQQEIKEKAIRNQPNNLLRSSVGDGVLKKLLNKHSYSELKCNDNAYEQASRRYHRYGYRVDMMGVPNVRTRKFFNFIQTSQVRIEGALNQAIKDGVADILNNGVTIWHGEYITKDNKGKFVLDYSKENIERSLL